MNAVLRSPSLGMLTETQRHGEVIAQLIKDQPAIRGNLVFDAHIAALMREHGIQTIYTHDADFNRFPGLEVVDPF